MEKLKDKYNNYLYILKELENNEDIEINKSRSFQYRPKISIITPVYNTDEGWLRLAVESVINQIYDNWELCIAYGGSTRTYIRAVLEEYAKKDERIKIKFLTENKGIVGNSNEALSFATGDYVGFMDHDDELTPDALYEVAKLLNEDRDIDFIYSDRDKISISGERYEPYFKPEWAPDTMRSNNYVCHFVAIRKRLIDEVGGFREGYEGSQDYDLYLRVVERTRRIAHIPKVLYHWRSHESSAAGNETAKMYAYDSAKKALKEHIQRIGLDGEILDGPFLGCYRIKYKIDDAPTVSIIVHIRDRVSELKRCVNSILERSSYENFKIYIVDNQRQEDETFRFYDELKNNHKVKILRYDKPFNYAAINNYAVSQMDSEYLIFLDSSIEVISNNWIESMLEFAQRADVGVVGGLLYFPDDTVQHTGVIIGLGGIAGYPYHSSPKTYRGYMGWGRLIQNLSAVTGACLMTKKSIFTKVGGFDEEYSFAFSDIDYCLKVRERGKLIVYTPYMELYLHESLIRDYKDAEESLRFWRDANLFREKWKEILKKGDPYYNPNLTLCRGDFSIKEVSEMFENNIQMYDLYSQVHNLNTAMIEKDAQISNLRHIISEKDKTIGYKNIIPQSITFSGLDIAAIKVLIVSGIDGASFIYRCLNLKEQFYYLGYHQVVCKLVHEVAPSDAYGYPVVILHRVYKTPSIIELIDLFKKNGNIVVYSTDDVVTDHNIETYLRLDKFLSVSELAQFHQGVDWTTELVKSSDAVLVSTDYLRSRINYLNSNVYVLENVLNEKQVKKALKIIPDTVKKRQGRKEIIIGYFSGWINDHDYDFAIIAEPLLRILNKYNNVKLRIVGYLNIDSRFEAFGDRVEQLDFVPFEVLPKFIADVDINLAPLESNPHKRSKSSIKYLEAGLLLVPTIASNLEPYNGIIKHSENGLLCSNSEEWAKCLQLLIDDSNLRFTIANNAHHTVRSNHTTIIQSSNLKTCIDKIIHSDPQKKFIQHLPAGFNTPLEGAGFIQSERIKSYAGVLHNSLLVDEESTKLNYSETLRGYETVEQFSSYIGEFIYFRDTVYIKGWAFHAELPIVEVGYIKNDNELHTIPWEGLPSSDVENIFGAKAKDCRFDLSFKIKEDEALDLVLVFKLSNGAVIKKSRLYEEGLKRGPWPWAWGPWPYDGCMHSGVIKEFIEMLKNSQSGTRILEIGSRARSGIIHRPYIVPDTIKYVGLDIIDGENVDVVGDAHKLSSYFPPDSFDFIYSMNVFEHLIMPWKVAIEMNRVLKENGIVMILTHQSFPLHDIPWDFWRYSDTAWHGLFNKFTGFEIIKTELGDPAKIFSSSIHQGTLGMYRHPAYVHSLVLAKKISDTILKWDIETEKILSTVYPKE